MEILDTFVVRKKEEYCLLKKKKITSYITFTSRENATLILFYIVYES